MPDPAGFDTGIRCPNCEEATLLTTANNKRKCPHCGYTEPHEDNKDSNHG